MLELLLAGAVLGVLGGFAAGGLVLLFALLMPAKKCPGCGQTLPKFRVPASAGQALWGGTTCPGCGCEVDHRGRKVEG
jgi:hypothetical protein